MVCLCVAVVSSFFPFVPFFFPFSQSGRCVGAYEWGASLRDVTRRVGSRRECRGWLERGDVGGVGGRWDVGWKGGTGGYMTQHIDLSLVERVRGRGAWRRVVYKGWGRKGGIKYTLSVKSTLFWDSSMRTILLKDCCMDSPGLQRHFRKDVYIVWCSDTAATGGRRR